MKLLIFAILISCSGCRFIDNIAVSVLYPWASVNQRMNIRDSKQPPDFANVIALPNGTHAFTSKTFDRPVAVLYLHGNGESVVDLADYGLLSWLDQMGVAWIVPDYPGMGIGGSGEPSEQSLVDTALFAQNELLRRVTPGTKVFVWGRSIGAAVAAQVALNSNDSIHGLILVSPWTNLKATASNNWLGRFVSDEFYSNNEYLTDSACKNIDVMTLIVHGTADTLIPIQLGQSLTSCFKEYRFYPINGLGHNDIYSTDALNMIGLFLNGF